MGHLDFLTLDSIIKQFTLGVSLSGDTLQLGLLSCHLNRLRVVDVHTLADFGQMSPAERRQQMQDFLQKNEVTHLDVVLSIPRQEVLLRELELPAEAQDNLEKVVEYQMVNLLPSEELAVSYDYLTVREESDPPRLQISIFVILQSTLDRYLDLCQDLGLHVGRIIPRPVALANYVQSSVPKSKSAVSLIALLDPPIGELVGLVQGQVKLCKEFQAVTADSGEVLGSEVDLFRGQAQLEEETPVELFLVGADELLPETIGGLYPQTVPLPEVLGAGETKVIKQEYGTYVPAIAAALCGFKRKCALDVNLLPAERRVQKSRWEMIPTYGLLAVNVLFLLVLLLLGPLQDKSYSERLGQELERLGPAVKAFRVLETETGHWKKRVQLLKQHKNLNAELLAALANLSLILPKDSMVIELSLKDGIIRLLGTSGSAAALPKILEDSPYFKSAAFVAAITRDSQERERYRIQASLEKPLPLKGSLGHSGVVTLRIARNLPTEVNQ